jgi:hypothetical protein
MRNKYGLTQSEVWEARKAIESLSAWLEHVELSPTTSIQRREKVETLRRWTDYLKSITPRSKEARS